MNNFQNPSRTCSFCVMDDSNAAIEFDEAGQCNCCREALARRPNEWWPDEEGARKMGDLVDMLRVEGKNKKYDAMVGLSGGIDSAFLAHRLCKEYGLRVLAVHVDGGWNSDAAVRNIETIVRSLDIDLFTYVVEWKEMRDLQKAFLNASVINQDIPQDHAFFAALYKTAGEIGIRYFLSGVNFPTESIIPPLGGHPYMDVAHIKGVHKRFGAMPLATYPFMDLSRFVWLSRVRKKLIVYKPLNYMNYEKGAAQAELKRHYNWVDYGSKHHESRFTKFYQQIYLPRKAHFDKRRLHFSSLIVSGQMSRDDAIKELEKAIIDDREEARDLRFVAKKLGMKPDELWACLEAPLVSHTDYPHRYWVHSSLTWLRAMLGKLGV